VRNNRLITSQVGPAAEKRLLAPCSDAGPFPDGKINRSVRIDSEIVIVERKHEGIDEDYPAKAWIALQVVHGNAIRNSYLNANQIENLRKIILAPFLAQFIIPFIEPGPRAQEKSLNRDSQTMP